MYKKDNAFLCIHTYIHTCDITLGYENQPEVLELFRRSSPGSSTSVTSGARSSIASIAFLTLKSPKKRESRNGPSTIGDVKEDKKVSAVPAEYRKASAVPNKFLEELRKNEQFKHRQASLETLENEKDEN